MSYPIDLKLKPSELMFGLFNYHNNHTFDGMDLSFTNPEPSNKVGFPDKVTVTSNTPIDGVDVAQALVHYTRIDINRLFSVCKLELLDKWLMPEIDMDAITAAVLYRYGVNLSTGFAVHAVQNADGQFALTAANSNIAYKGTVNISIVKSLSVSRVQVKALNGLRVSDGGGDGGVTAIAPFQPPQTIPMTEQFLDYDNPPYSIGHLFGSTHAYMINDSALVLLDLETGESERVMTGFVAMPNFPKKINQSWSLGTAATTLSARIELDGTIFRIYSPTEGDWNVRGLPNVRSRHVSKMMLWKDQNAVAFLNTDVAYVINGYGLQLTQNHNSIANNETVRPLDVNNERLILIGESTVRTIEWNVTDTAITVSTPVDLACAPELCAKLVNCRSVGAYVHEGKAGYLMVNTTPTTDSTEGYFVSLEDKTVTEVVVNGTLTSEQVAIGSMSVFDGGVVANNKDNSAFIYQPVEASAPPVEPEVPEVPEVELAPANWGASTKTIENYQMQDMPDMFSIVSVDRALTNVAASVGPMFGEVSTKLRSSVTGKRSWGFPARTSSPIVIGQQKDALPEATNDWTMLCYGEFGGKDVIVRGAETSEAGHKFTPAFGRGLMRELDNGNYLIVAGNEYGVTSWPSNKATVEQAPHHITLHPTKPIALECIDGKWYVNKLTDGNVAVVDRTELNNQMEVQVDTSNPANNVQVIGYDVAADAVYFSTKESIVKGEYGIWRVGSGKLISGKIEDADKVAELAASTHFLGTANSIFYNVGDGWGFKHMTYGDNV